MDREPISAQVGQIEIDMYSLNAIPSEIVFKYDDEIINKACLDTPDCSCFCDLRPFEALLVKYPDLSLENVKDCLLWIIQNYGGKFFIKPSSKQINILNDWGSPLHTRDAVESEKTFNRFLLLKNSTRAAEKFNESTDTSNYIGNANIVKDWRKNDYVSNFEKLVRRLYDIVMNNTEVKLLFAQLKKIASETAVEVQHNNRATSSGLR